MKQKNKTLSLLLRDYYGKYNSFIVFFILLTGVMISSFNYIPNNNLWQRLYNIYTNSFFQITFLIAIGYNTMSIIENISQKFDIIIRFETLKTFISFMLKRIILSILYLSVVVLILAFSGALLLSFGNHSLIEFTSYSIPLILYLMFFIVRMTLIVIILNVMIYLIYLAFKKIGCAILVLAECVLLWLLPNNRVVEHFYQMHFIPLYYLKEVKYVSFLTEFICSVIEILVLLIISKLIITLIMHKKRDVSI